MAGSVNAVCLKMGLESKLGLGVWRVKVEVVRVRKAIDVVAGRWTRVRRARRARGDINRCIVMFLLGVE